MIELLFPKKCCYCKKSGYNICPNCLQLVVNDIKNYQKCPKCHKPSYSGFTHPSCTPYGLDGVYILYQYSPIIRTLLSEYKYKFIKNLESPIIDLFLKGLADNDILNYWKNNKFCLIAVPSFKTKNNWRGFDSLKKIGETVAQKTGLGLNDNSLKKIKWTKQQAGLSKKERRQNIKDAYQIIGKETIKNVLIVDDVYTTGSTLEQIAKLFKKNNSSKVWGLTLTG